MNSGTVTLVYKPPKTNGVVLAGQVDWGESTSISTIIVAQIIEVNMAGQGNFGELRQRMKFVS